MQPIIIFLLQTVAIFAIVCFGEEQEDVIRLPIFLSEDEMLKTIDTAEPGVVKAVLVLSYGNGGDHCTKIVEKFDMKNIITEMSQHSEEEFGVPGMAAAVLTDKEYEKRHSLKNCPNLILYREKKPIVYDGGNLHMRFIREDIGQWVASNMKSNVEHLSDETFEHLTQASTGSTTGDWLIWFHSSSCSDLSAVWDALAARLKYAKVIGEVDITLNPKLAKRFHLPHCQSIHLFRQGKYYTYTGDVFDVQALANFAEISYKNFNSQIITPPPSPFDDKVEQLTIWLKESEYGLYILTTISFSLFGGIIYLVCKESRDFAAAEKKDD